MGSSSGPPVDPIVSITAEVSSAFQKFTDALGQVFGSADAAKKDLEALAKALPSPPAEIREHYMPISYFYGAPMMCSSSGVHHGSYSARQKCSTCGALRDPYLDGTLCAACKAKLDQVMDSSRELSPDEVGRALSEFVRKKLAKVEDVGDVRARGINLDEKADESKS